LQADARRRDTTAVRRIIILADNKFTVERVSRMTDEEAKDGQNMLNKDVWNNRNYGSWRLKIAGILALGVKV
jgi:hypothetical protein